MISAARSASDGFAIGRENSSLQNLRPCADELGLPESPASIRRNFPRLGAADKQSCARGARLRCERHIDAHYAAPVRERNASGLARRKIHGLGVTDDRTLGVERRQDALDFAPSFATFGQNQLAIPKWTVDRPEQMLLRHITPKSRNIAPRQPLALQ